MSDKVSKDVRSKMMRAVKSKKTKLEDSISKELWKRGIRFRRNSNKLFGKPDISIKTRKVVIFIDSCFWHGCKLHCKIPNTNVEYWGAKIKRNKTRDEIVTRHYKELGWNILRVWEHEIKADFIITVNKIAEFIINI